MKHLRPFAFYFFYFAGIAFMMPFLVLYYQSLNFSGTEIGLLTGLTPLITLITAPFWTGLADRWRQHRLIMSITMLAGIAILSLIPLARAFLPTISLIVLFNIFFSPVTSFADNATMFMLGNKKELYGRLRVGGTFGFGIAVLVAGVIAEKYGLRLVFWCGALTYLIAFLAAYRFSHGEAQPGGSAAQGGVRYFLTNGRWLLFLTGAFAAGLGIAVTNNYLFSYLKELGASEVIMGLSLTAGTVGEVPVLFFGNRLLKWFKPYGLFLLAIAFTGVRLLLFGALKDANVILFLQLFNGLTFPAMWIAGVAYADRNAPPGLSATAQGMFSAMIFGFGVAVGGFLGGLLLDTVGGQGIYLVAGTIVLVIIGLVALLGTRFRAEPQPAPTGQQA